MVCPAGLFAEWHDERDGERERERERSQAGDGIGLQMAGVRYRCTCVIEAGNVEREERKLESSTRSLSV